MRSGLITVLKIVQLNRDSNGSLLFGHKPILKHKRTVIVRGSRFSRSDRTVRSGFQNLDYRLEWHFIRDILELYRFPPFMINGGKLELF